MMKIGYCHLCFEEKELNTEHVPPQSAYNKNTRYIEVPLLDYLKAKDPAKYKAKGRVNQGGITCHSFCVECNNSLGIKYVNDYKAWARVGFEVMRKVENKKGCYNFHALVQNPNKILKQVVSMFIAINDYSFAQNNKDLVEYVRNEQSKKLPDRFRIFTYLNNGPQFRYLPVFAKGSFDPPAIIMCSEMAYPPFGFVLTINCADSPSRYLTELTNFQTYEQSQDNLLKFEMFELETHSQISLDYKVKGGTLE
jgi:hypothetical protein